jgi:hypothetical protein
LSFDLTTKIFIGDVEKDISNLVDVKNVFKSKEFSLENSKELIPSRLEFKASKQLSLITGNVISDINDKFIVISDKFDRTFWAGFIDDIREDKNGNLSVKSLNFAAKLSKIDLKTDPVIEFDGVTPIYPTDAILAIWDGSELNIPARFIDRVSFEDVKGITGEQLRLAFDDKTKALDAIQEIMMCAGFVIYTHQNVLRCKVLQTDIIQYNIDENEIIGFPAYSFAIDEHKTTVRGAFSTDRTIQGVNTGNDTVNVDNHGYTNGDRIQFYVTAGALPGGLESGKDYFIFVTGVNFFSVHNTRREALNDFNRVDISSTGGGVVINKNDQEFTLDPTNVAVLGSRPFVLKQDVFFNTGNEFDNIALRILEFFGASQRQAVLNFELILDWIKPEHQAKYYLMELYDFLAVHTSELRIESILTEKKVDGSKLSLKFKGTKWESRDPNNIDFRFESDSLIFPFDSSIQYEILRGSRWQVFDLKKTPIQDIGGLPNPVHLRFRTFKNNTYSAYVNLKLIITSPYYVGVEPFSLDDIDSLLLESGSPLSSSWGDLIQI